MLFVDLSFDLWVSISSCWLGRLSNDWRTSRSGQCHRGEWQGNRQTRWCKYESVSWQWELESSVGKRRGEKQNLEKRGKRGSDCNFYWFVLHLHHLSCHSHTFGFHAVTRDVMFGLSRCAPCWFCVPFYFYSPLPLDLPPGGPACGPGGRSKEKTA